MYRFLVPNTRSWKIILVVKNIENYNAWSAADVFVLLHSQDACDAPPCWQTYKSAIGLGAVGALLMLQWQAYFLGAIFLGFRF